MVQLIASVAAFAFGLLFLPTVFSGMRVRGTSSALKAGAIGGALSVTVGKVLVAVLTLVFLPIALLGAVGVFVIQAVVNGLILMVTARMSEGVEFDGIRTTIWVAVALTALQTIVRLVG